MFEVLSHALLQALFLEHTLLLILLLLALLFFDLFLELLLHLHTLLVFFALDYIFFVSAANQNTALLFKVQIKAAVEHSTSRLDLREILLGRIIHRRHHRWRM